MPVLGCRVPAPCQRRSGGSCLLLRGYKPVGDTVLRLATQLPVISLHGTTKGLTPALVVTNLVSTLKSYWAFGLPTVSGSAHLALGVYMVVIGQGARLLERPLANLLDVGHSVAESLTSHG